MKLFSFKNFAASVIIFSLVSCSIDNDVLQEPRIESDDLFYADIEQVDSSTPDTRAYVDDQLRVLWHKDDRISIFNRSTYNQEYRFNGLTGDNGGSFSKVDNDAFVTGNSIPYVYAVYPYSAETRISYDDVLSFELPKVQHMTDGSFDPKAFFMISAGTDNNLSFKNTEALFVLKLYGHGSVASITLKGRSGERIAGKAQMPIADGVTSKLDMMDANSTELTLYCANTVALNESVNDYKEFWFVLPPTVFSAGFDATIVGANGTTIVKSTHNSVAMARNTISRMAPFSVDLGEDPAPIIDPANVTINKTSFPMAVDNTVQLKATVVPDNASDKSVKWSSSNESIATVSASGKVSAKKAGSCTIKVTTVNGISSMCTVTVKPATGSENGHEWVNLGLSVKWATCNVGATKPIDAGQYFGWGETGQKASCTLEYYRWYEKPANGSSGYLTKYCTKKQYGYRGFTDGKTTLELSDDAARKQWKGEWRTPTAAEAEELYSKCSWTCTIVDGELAYRVTSKVEGFTNQSIILRHNTGYKKKETVYSGAGTYYWTSSVDSTWPNYAKYMGCALSYTTFRYYGIPIRAVVE